MRDFKAHVLAGYTRTAREMITRSDVIDNDALFGPVRHLFPKQPCRIADIGGGSGRDTIWFAQQGHAVTVTEPVDPIRQDGEAKCKGLPVTWHSDALPDLPSLSGSAFDFVLINGVWQHLDPKDRSAAMHRLADILAQDGSMVISLRHGPGAKGRPVLPIPTGSLERDARAAGLRVTDRIRAASVQAENRAAGVVWDWCRITFDR